MKVALISDCYPPRVGGIESQVRDLARRLVEAGHDVEVLTATNGADGATHGAREVIDGITVHRLGTRVPFGLPVNPGGGALLRDRLEAGRFDVAHAHVGVISPFAVDGADLALELGIPVTVTWHCVLGVWEPVVRRLGHAERWARAGAALHGVSEMAAEQVRSLAPGAPVTVLHNGIDAAAWRAVPTTRPPHTPGAPPQPLRVVLAMRFTPRKRPLSVIGIVRRARERAVVPITLEICGGGPLLEPVRAVVRRRGWADWVSLPGRIDRESLLAHYRAADVYLASSRFESFGIAALEGRTVGLPVVALRGSGAEDFVTDGVTGLVRDGDDGLVEGLVELAADRGLLGRLRTHNERVPPDQDWSRVVSDVEEEYARARRLLSGGREGRHTETVNHWLVRIEAVDGVGRTGGGAAGSGLGRRRWGRGPPGGPDGGRRAPGRATGGGAALLRGHGRVRRPPPRRGRTDAGRGGGCGAVPAGGGLRVRRERARDPPHGAVGPDVAPGGVDAARRRDRPG